MTAGVTHRLTWRCTECPWGVTVPGRVKQVEGQQVTVPDDEDIVHEVMFEHVAKHEPMGSFRREVVEMGPDQEWDDDY